MAGAAEILPEDPAFGYESGCEILTIRPQDIGRLPRESWVYGNNSFLLHGYHNYNHLLLVEEDGHYWLGVPGIYDPMKRGLPACSVFHSLPVLIQKRFN